MGGSAQTKSLADYKAIYEAEVGKLDTELEAIVSQGLMLYTQQLVRVRGQLQQQGDLDGVIAFDKEIARFRADKTIPAEDSAVQYSTLKAVRATCRKRISSAKLSRMRKHGALAQRYLELLNALKKQLMTQGEFSGALEAKTEIGRIDFILADLQTRLPPEKKKPARPVPVTPPRRRLPPLALRRGLALYYPFDREEGDEVTNTAGKGLNGRVLGAKWIRDDGRGGAMDFGGDGDKIEVTDTKDLDLTKGLTIVMWLKPRVLGCRQNPFEKAYGGEGTMTLEPDGSINYFYGVSGRNDSPYTHLGLTKTLKANEWSHVILVRDHKRRALTWYKNGIKANETKPRWEKTASSSYPIRIGSGYAGGFNGAIDDLMIWNRALSPLEVRQLWQWVGKR